jgi:hypothetical protein
VGGGGVTAEVREERRVEAVRLAEDEHVALHGVVADAADGEGQGVHADHAVKA